MFTFDMDALGWADYFASSLADLADDSLSPARVVEERRLSLGLMGPAGPLEAEVSGRLRHHALRPSELPAVGDWVAVTPRQAEGRATIRHVLARRSVLARKGAGRDEEQVIAANVDAVLIVSSLDRDLSERRIERYLALAWESGAQPVVVLTKADLCDDPDALVGVVEAVAVGAPVHAVSALSGVGVEALEPYMARGRTAALVGSSGVGKSTLVNRLLGEDRLAVGAVRADDGRGRHTTTQRRLVAAPGGGLLVDTPGMREVGLWDAAGGLEVTFGDIGSLAGDCRFADCAHADEPGCAVRAAVDQGTLDPLRLQSYFKLLREERRAQRKNDGAGRAAQRRANRAFNKLVRTRKRLRDAGLQPDEG